MPYYCDYHMHSHHSFDAHCSVQEMAQAAVDAGLSEICFTDHIDMEDPAYRDVPADLGAQREEIESVRGALPLVIKRGAEIGLSRNREDGAFSWAYVEKHELDFIIGSLHLVEGKNSYYPSFFEGRTQREGYIAYVESLADSLATCPEISVLGHYDFVAKYAPFSDRTMTYSIAPEAFDRAFRYLAQNGKGMEVNTAAWQDDPAWGLDVLRRFRALGGEFVTFGSDAHRPERVGRRLEEARELARAAGLRYTATFERLVPTFLPL